MNRTRLPFVILLTSVLAACGGKPVEPDLKIGLIAELSGEIPAVGTSCKNAAELAVVEINQEGLKAAGTKHGLKLFVQDSANQADKAVAEVNRLIKEEGVLAIVGPNASVGAIPAAEAAEAGQTLLITPWSTNPRTTLDAAGQPKKWVARACFTDAFEGTVLAKFAHDYLKASKAAMLYDSGSEAPKSQSEIFKKDFEAAGGTVVASETYASGARDFTQQLEKIKAAKPDIVFLPSYYSDVPMQLRQAHNISLNVPFLGSDNWSTPELVKLAGKDAEGAVFCNHYWAGARNEITGRFVVSYEKRYGVKPDDVAALTYDAIQLLAKAIRTAGTLDRAAIRDAFFRLNEYQGVTGKMTYKPGSGDPVKGAVMMKVANGQFTWITNIDPE